MGGDKDLIIQNYGGGVSSSPLVSPLNKFEEQMYNEMTMFRKQIKQIKKILEVCNEKSTTDDSNTGANRL